VDEPFFYQSFVSDVIAVFGINIICGSGQQIFELDASSLECLVGAGVSLSCELAF